MNTEQEVKYLIAIRNEDVRIKSELKKYGYTDDQIKDIDKYVNHIAGLSYTERWFIAADNILNDLKRKKNE